MGEWSEEQKCEAERRRQEALDRAKTTFKYGDMVDCPAGPAMVLKMRLGGYELVLLTDVEALPENRTLQDVAFYVPTADVRPLSEP